jgi:hypothetical protein
VKTQITGRVKTQTKQKYFLKRFILCLGEFPHLMGLLFH